MNSPVNQTIKNIQGLQDPAPGLASYKRPSPSDEMQENPWGYRRRLQFMEEVIAGEFADRVPASVRILDIGCGNGSWVAIPLARRGFDVTGIDLHQPSIETAERLAEGLPNAHFVASGVEELHAAPFDVVILSEVLEHVHDPEALLRMGAGQLRPGGIVIVTVPNGYGEFEIDWWIYRTFGLEHVVSAARKLFPFLRSGDHSGEEEAIAATDNHACGHVQFFKLPVLRQIFANCSLVAVKSAAASFVCGPMAVLVLARSRRLMEWNIQVAKRLPLVLGSGWYFVLRQDTHPGR
jgi:2-polyprenyl-3-methyl-5-hydroxy-6-metoxy-1,4-benzoquinol methylase